jgi:hypothetical protein
VSSSTKKAGRCPPSSTANVHDTKLLAATIDAVVIPRLGPVRVVQNLCLDKGYDNPTGEAACAAGGYVPHIRRIGEGRRTAGAARPTQHADGSSSARSRGYRSAVRY